MACAPGELSAAAEVAGTQATMFGFPLDVPCVLTHCPRCRTEQLTWNSRGAWQCTGEHCDYGITINAIFDDDGLEFEVSLGKRLSLGTIALSAIGAVLVYLGILKAKWVDEAAALARLARIATDDRDALSRALGVAL